MLLVLSTATIVLSLVMVYINAGKFPASVYLGLLLILISLCCYSQYQVIFLPAFDPYDFILPITGVMVGFVGPSLYFYMKSVLKENTRVGNKDLWQFIPPVLFFVSSFMFDAYSFMEKKRPWLQAQCNLVHFSKITCIPTHHLACYYKYIKQQNFNNICNRWRINYAKSRLSQNKASGLSLQEIGFISGFSSQRRFFRTFRKAERVSIRAFPSQNF